MKKVLVSVSLFCKNAYDTGLDIVFIEIEFKVLPHPRTLVIPNLAPMPPQNDWTGRSSEKDIELNLIKMAEGGGSA